MKTVLMAVAIVTAAAPAFAETHTVRMMTAPEAKQVYSFSPARLVIKPGDTVRFIDAQNDTHDVMFESVPNGVDAAMSPMLEHKGQSWSYTFKTPGTYEYHCHPHEALGMHGAVIVKD